MGGRRAAASESSIRGLAPSLTCRTAGQGFDRRAEIFSGGGCFGMDGDDRGLQPVGAVAWVPSASSGIARPIPSSPASQSDQSCSSSEAWTEASARGDGHRRPVPFARRCRGIRRRGQGGYSGSLDRSAAARRREKTRHAPRRGRRLVGTTTRPSPRIAPQGGRKRERNQVFWVDVGDGYVYLAFQIGASGLLRGAAAAYGEQGAA